MTTKLEELHRDIERLDQISDQQVADEEAAVRKLTEVRWSCMHLLGHCCDACCLKCRSMDAGRSLHAGNV